MASLYLRSKRETIDQSLVDNPTINRGIGLLLPDVLSEVELVKASEVRRLTIEKLGLESRKVKPSDPTVDKVAQRAVWDAYLYDNLLIEAATSANVININRHGTAIPSAPPRSPAPTPTATSTSGARSRPAARTRRVSPPRRRRRRRRCSRPRRR